MNLRVIKISLCLLAVTWLGTGCKKDSNHYIRIKNSYVENMDVVKIDAINYGAVKKGKVTDYKQVLEGSFTISGTAASGAKLQGDGSVKGDGTHHWTMTIMSSGGISLNEDK